MNATILKFIFNKVQYIHIFTKRFRNDYSLLPETFCKYMYILHLIKYEFKDCCIDFSIYKLNICSNIAGNLFHLNLGVHGGDIATNHPHLAILLEK